jgi:hypothetical protein
MEQAHAAIGGKKLVLVGCLLGLTILLAGSACGVDWLGPAMGSSFVLPMLGKPGITVLAALIALCATGNSLGRISDVMFRAVWLFHTPNIVLWALSGSGWVRGKEKG